MVPRLLFGHAFGQRPIDFRRIALAQGFRECGSGGNRTRDHQHAGGIAIEAMDKARSLFLAEGERIKHPVDMLRQAGAALRCEAGRFVEHDHLLILIEDEIDQHASVLRFFRARLRLVLLACVLQLRRQAQYLAAFETLVGFRAFAVDADLAGAQQFFQMAVRQCRVIAFEPAIQTDAAVFIGNMRAFRHFRSPARAGDPQTVPRRREPPIRSCRWRRLHRLRVRSVTRCRARRSRTWCSRRECPP